MVFLSPFSNAFLPMAIAITPWMGGICIWLCGVSHSPAMSHDSITFLLKPCYYLYDSQCCIFFLAFSFHPHSRAMSMQTCSRKYCKRRLHMTFAFCPPIWLLWGWVVVHVHDWLSLNTFNSFRSVSSKDLACIFNVCRHMDGCWHRRDGRMTDVHHQV